MRNIVLIGLPGSGKTSLGRQAAAETGLEFFDTDAEIERREGLSVRDIFERRGEAYFREVEATVVAAVSRRTRALIATGGGTPLREENRRALKETGFVIFLDRPPEEIARIPDGAAKRPLLAENPERIFSLAAERRPIYSDMAEARIRARKRFRTFELLAALIRSEHPGDGYAVIGDPIAHSLSPAIHGAVFRRLGETADYRTIHVRKGTLPAFVKNARASGLRGFNVTSPHKRDILPLLDEIDDEARLCGAVNTVVARNGRLRGCNTDMAGLASALDAAGRSYAGREVGVLGAGGAAAGVALKALLSGARGVTILGRDAAKAETLAAEIRAAFAGAAGEAAPDSAGARLRARAMTEDALSATAARADLLINATPLGMSGAKCDFPSFAFLDALPPRAFVCDLVYNPPETALLRAARARGLPCMNGKAMLLYQALAADALFLGRDLDAAALFAVAEAATRAPAREAGRAGKQRGERGGERR